MQRDVTQTRCPAADLSARERDALVIVASEDRPHGLGVKAELEAVYGHEINNSSLYPTLDGLVDAGLVAKGTVDERTNYYELTTEGRNVLAADLRWRTDNTDFEDLEA